MATKLLEYEFVLKEAFILLAHDNFIPALTCQEQNISFPNQQKYEKSLSKSISTYFQSHQTLVVNMVITFTVKINTFSVFKQSYVDQSKLY